MGHLATTSVSVMLTLTAACASDGTQSNGRELTQRSPGRLDAREAPEPDADELWKTLASVPWELPAGEETYRCARVTLRDDLAINAFRTLSPQGTHHMELTIADDGSAPDGTTECEPNTNGVLPASVREVC
jgi:hypothetical protein